MEIGRHCASLPLPGVGPTKFLAMTRTVFRDDYRYLRAGGTFRPRTGSGADRPRLGFDIRAEAISRQSGADRNRYAGPANASRRLEF